MRFFLPTPTFSHLQKHPFLDLRNRNSLASEGFRELNQGQGIVLDGPQELADFIGQIGCEAAREVKRRIVGD